MYVDVSNGACLYDEAAISPSVICHMMYRSTRQHRTHFAAQKPQARNRHSLLCGIPDMRFVMKENRFMSIVKKKGGGGVRDAVQSMVCISCHFTA